MSRKKSKGNNGNENHNGTGITIYTDGGCAFNPGGPGGYGCVIVRPGKKDVSLNGGFIASTNNRMEIYAAIVGLTEIGDEKEPITLVSDSPYLVNTMNLGWAKKKNHDMWAKLDEVLKGKNVIFKWVRGHNGNKYNEICDSLATAGMDNPSEVDEGFDPSAVKNRKPGGASGSMGVKIDIPEKYKDNTIYNADSPETLARIADIKESCAEAVFLFLNEEKKTFKTYAALKTGGRDYWSAKNKDELIAKAGQEAYDLAMKVTDDAKISEYALRWHMRGLSLYDAIRKVLVDKEISDNTIKGRAENWKV